MFIAILYVSFSVALGLAAEHRFNRHCGAWFVFSLVASPLTALAFLLAMGARKPRRPALPPPLPGGDLDAVIAYVRST